MQKINKLKEGKDMKNKILAGVAVIILIGIIIIAAVGFNLETNYKEYKLIDIKIGKEFNISDIETITNEVFSGKKVEIKKIGDFEDSVAIKVTDTDVSDEQKNTLNTKINEKYGIENTVDSIKINSVPKIKVFDLIKPYIVPVIFITAIVLVYMAIRFSKIGAGKVVLQTLGMTAMAELLYFAIIAITRHPFNGMVMPVALVIYVAILMLLTRMFEKQRGIEE